MRSAASSHAARPPRGAATVLAVGGLDPCGGAGVLADARAILLAGAWPLAVCATLTVQSSRGLAAVRSVPAAFVRAQIDELLADGPCDVMKTGALGSARHARLVTRIVRAHGTLRLVVDPVLAATRTRARAGRLNELGRALDELAAHAALITPNAPEAELMLGTRIDSRARAAASAQLLARRFGCAVLLKGGHLGRGPMLRDYLATEEGVSELERPRLHTPALHGTGCTLAALLAGRLAVARVAGRPSHAAWCRLARWAGARMSALIAHARPIGSGAWVLGVPR